MTRPDEPLAPSRRLRRSAPPAAPPVSDYEDAEIARGQSAALLGALGRMQLKLDLLAREQSESLARLEAKVDALQQTIDRLTAAEGSHSA